MTVRSFAAVCLLALGVLVVVIAAVGMFRFRRTLELLQASALADTLGLLLILAGLALLCGFTTTSTPRASRHTAAKLRTVMAPPPSSPGAGGLKCG